MNTWSILFSFILAVWISSGSYIYTCVHHKLCCDDCMQNNEEVTTSPDTSSTDTNKENKASITDTISSNQNDDKISDSGDVVPQEVEEKLNKEYTVYFPTGSTEPILESTTQEFIQLAEKYLSQNIEAKISIIGHTDNTGTPEQNLVFGKQRAEIIKIKLTQDGIPVDKIITESKGQTEPVADNETEAGRKKNRRVVISIKE